MPNLLKLFTPMRPPQPPAPLPQNPFRFNLGPPREEKPWPVWFFIAYIICLLMLWLIAKPIMDELVTQLIDPLSIAGYLNFFYHAFVWILFIGLAWIAFKKTFSGRGE